MKFSMVLRLALWLLVSAAGVAIAQHGTQPLHGRFDDAERWARVFDDPQRDAWQKPDEVIRVLKLAPEAAVADIGSGTGYFAVRFARALPKGRVFGADLEPDMVRYLNARAKREALPNLASHVAAPDDPRLPAPVDLVMVVDTYHHIGNREAYFRKVRSALKPEGRVAIVDFKPDSPVGPPRHARIPAEQVRAELQRAGFRLVETHEFLPYQYLLVFASGAQ